MGQVVVSWVYRAHLPGLRSVCTIPVVSDEVNTGEGRRFQSETDRPADKPGADDRYLLLAALRTHAPSIRRRFSKPRLRRHLPAGPRRCPVDAAERTKRGAWSGTPLRRSTRGAQPDLPDGRAVTSVLRAASTLAPVAPPAA